ncbi:hypothetical protein U1839_06455 [Sphingomonas sp. RT2P30]|uniref:hypothetical protein n=1 Tax=Parasphingomonas halimpatiens TaxID=3096162 RepID=UPI002FC8FFE1
MKTPLRLAIALGAVLLIAAKDGGQVGAPPLRLIETISPQGPQKVMPGAIISRALIGRPDSAVLGDDITLDWKGEKRSFAHGDILHAESVSGVTGIPDAVFCEEEQKASMGKVMTGQMLFGLVGALRGTHLNTRYCVFDADGDKSFDHAFLIGAKGDQGRAPFVIPPARYGLIEGIELGGESVARLRYVGPAGNSNSISIDLEVSGFGMMRDLAEPRTVIPITRLPAYKVINGAVVTVLAYDAKTMEATIRMDHDLAPGHIVLPELSHGY